MAGSDLALALLAGGRERPDEPAFHCAGERLTRGELLADAARIAAGLRAAGVGAGHRIALVLPAGLPFVRGFAGAVLAGAAPFAIPAGLHAPTASRRAARGRPTLLLTAAARQAELATATAGAGFAVAALERLLAAPAPAGPPRLEDVDPEAPAFLQLTSGTTGEPRLALLSHRAIAAWRRNVAGRLDQRAGDVLVGWVPPWHVMGLVRFVLQPILAGVAAHLVLPEVGRLGEWLETVARARGTFTSAPDFALRTAVRLVGDRSLDLSSLRMVVSGGEPVRLATIRAFEARFGLPGVVRPAYGLSEATLAVTAAAPGEPLTIDAAGHVSCGRPLPGFDLRVVAAGGGDCRPGEAGEIWVRSESLFSGYFGAEGPDTSALCDGWLRTGDWGRLGSAGELYVLGRRRNLLKHGGATYAPRELEEAAEGVAGVLVAAAVALRDRERGEELPVLVVEAEASGVAPEALARDVALAVRRALGLLPGEVLIVEPGALPRTDNGKLRHAELRRQLAAGELEAGRIRCGRAGGWSE